MNHDLELTGNLQHVHNQRRPIEVITVTVKRVAITPSPIITRSHTGRLWSAQQLDSARESAGRSRLASRTAPERDAPAPPSADTNAAAAHAKRTGAATAATFPHEGFV